MTVEQRAMYRFSATLASHASDVRALASFADDRIVSGSRDGSVKVWRFDEASGKWQVQFEMNDVHDNKYVTAVATRGADEIVTGTQDGRIRLFSSAELKRVVEDAHKEAVVSLFVSDTGTVVSGSWDMTAKVWVGAIDAFKCVMTLKGHEAAVWDAVLLNKQGLILTASADNTIKVWKAGALKETLTAHNQAVRGLSFFGGGDATTFASCSNDGRVVVYNVDSNKFNVMEDVSVFDGFLYAIQAVDENTVVTAGETSGVRIVGRTQEEQQVLQVPALSVWSLCVLSNGDIAAGCSDGHIWVFSKEQERQADAEAKALYDELLSKNALPAATTLEGLNADDLPGTSALLVEGKRDGQTMLIKDGANISVHSWSQAERRWAKVGDVVGAPGDDGRPKGSAPGGGKVVFEGKEYDFVFDVDIADGVILKLPYNRNEDPYHAAQKFIHKHELPQAYLDTVANFIFKNSGQTASVQQHGGACDPFTGSSAYSTSSASTTAMEVDGCAYFPRTNFVMFAQRPKVDAVKEKLFEFNSQQEDKDKVEEKLIEGMANLTTEGHSPDMDEVSGVIRALRWPSEMAFPALDIMRLAVINPRVASLLFNEETGNSITETLISLLLQFLTPSAPPKCQMLALRTLANLFTVPEGLKAVLGVRDSVVRRAGEVLPSENKNVQIAVASLLLNLTIASVSLNDTLAQSQCLLTIGCLGLDAINDAEAKFRLLVAVGTLVQDSQDNRATAKELMVSDKIKGFKDDQVEKVATCASAISRLL